MHMDAWEKVENWLRANCPRAYKNLGKPAKDAKIAQLEKKLSVKLPAEAIDIYRRHDGQTMGPPIAGDWKFLSLKSVEIQWEIQKKLLDDGAFASATATAKGPVRPLWWNAKWIPVTFNGSGDLQCIDLDPADGGKIGQIVVYRHDHELRECIAESFVAWLDDLATDMESGKFAIEDERIVRR
jgi:cell wall assembly regulator SMI1